MNKLLILAYLFFCGSTLGWVIELVYRNFISRTRVRGKWINPGFCIGPYVPLYGFGLCILYLLATLEGFDAVKNPTLEKILLIAAMTVSMTLIEYLAGIICLKAFKVRLWDYSNRKFNIQGIICPTFSFIWGALGALYLLFVHKHILASLEWLSQNLAFSFVIGLFFGVFIIDVCYSGHLIAKIKNYANENGVVVKWEKLKAEIKSTAEQIGKRTPFLFPFKFHHLITERGKAANQPPLDATEITQP